MAWGSPSESPFESREQQLTRVRRRISAAVLHKGKTWERLFQDCDRNRDGTLDWPEMKTLMREVLNVPNVTVCDHELLVLFDEIDADASGAVDAAELLDFLQRGRRPVEEDRNRYEVRMQRVHRNLRMAWKDVSGN